MHQFLNPSSVCYRAAFAYTCTVSDPQSAKSIPVFIKHPKKLKYLRFLADAIAKRNKQQQGSGYAPQSWSRHLHFTSPKLYSFSSHPFSISMRVGSAPSSAPIIQKTVRPVNRPPFPLLREGFTCIPLQKMVPTSIPLKSLVTPLYHRVFSFWRLYHYGWIGG